MWATVQRLWDRAQIEDLVVQYCIAMDDGDAGALRRMFAQQATLGASSQTLRGRDAVVDFLLEQRARQQETVHTPDAHVVDFDDETDRAQGTVLSHVELGRGDGTYVGAVRYIDNYVRENGTWRFAHRHMEVRHLGPWTDVATSLNRGDRVGRLS